MELLISQFFDLALMQEALPFLLAGLRMTLLICVVIIPVGLVLGMLTAIASSSPRRAIRWPMIAFIDFFRALPPLVVLIFAYSGLPFFGVRPTPFQAVCLAFIANITSYYCEVFRAGLDSVGTGQYEAAASTGLGRATTLLYIIIPQAIRNVIPDLISNTIEVVKLTSLASVVAIPDLLYNADVARASTYNATPMVLAAIIYLVLLLPVVRLMSRMEHRGAG